MYPMELLLPAVANQGLLAVVAVLMVWNGSFEIVLKYSGVQITIKFPRDKSKHDKV